MKDLQDIKDIERMLDKKTDLDDKPKVKDVSLSLGRLESILQ